MHRALRARCYGTQKGRPGSGAMLDVVFGQASDPGRVRTNNEDAMGSFIPASRHQARSHGYLFAVADGVGGLELGEVASSTAIQVLTEEFAKAQPGSMLISLLPQLIQFANSAVHDHALAPEHRGTTMATTLVACALRNDQAIVSHVGDSRCYLIRNRFARQITQDHTWVNEQRKLGVLSEADIAQSEQRHVLMRSLGVKSLVTPETTALTLQPGDILVLCSDGLHDELGTGEIADIVSQSKPMDLIASELVARAVEIDGNDNTTAQVIRIRSVEQVGMYRGRPYRLS
ncbi:MAG TPA: protein phosphatase 2C domain-containing protein [Terracidiphilus sp.]